MMNKIPDYIIDSMVRQIKTIMDSNVNDSEMLVLIDKEVNEIKKMNDGVVPKKVEVLVESLKPKKVEVKIEQQGFNFSRLQSLSQDDMSDMDPKELSKLINELAKSYYEHKIKIVQG